MCWDDEADTVVDRLVIAAFGMHRHHEADGAVGFNLPYGEWVRLFRRNGLTIEALIEIQPEEGAESTYRSAEETAWARRWPMEEIWKVRKWS
jgi:hypothetical protein